MRVYHFLNKKYGLESISKRRLKIARLTELNDPFEFFAFNLADKQLRKAIKSIKNQYSNEKGILCFSKHWSNPLLWGHYADKHKGICLGFDIPSQYLKRITYLSDRATLDHKSLDKNDTVKILFAKYEGWSYEEEYRLWISINEPPNEDGLHFQYYSDEIELKEIIIGCESDISRSELDEVLGNNFSDIKPHKVRTAFQCFKIIKNKNQKIWT